MTKYNNVVFKSEDVYKMTEEARNNVIFDSKDEYLSNLRAELARLKMEEKLTKANNKENQAKIRYQMAIMLKEQREMEENDKYKRGR